MAQDFESAFSTKIMSGSFTNLLSSNSDDAVIGIRFSNLHSGSVTVDAKITRGSKDYLSVILVYIIIPLGKMKCLMRIILKHFASPVFLN